VTAALYGPREEVQLGRCGILRLSLNYDTDRDLRETFIEMGKNGSCRHVATQGISRLIGLCLRHDIPPDEIAGELRGLTCSNETCTSCLDWVAQKLTQPYQWALPQVTGSEANECPECGANTVYHEAGCSTCKQCGWSACEVG